MNFFRCKSIQDHPERGHKLQNREQSLCFNWFYGSDLAIYKSMRILNKLIAKAALYKKPLQKLEGRLGLQFLNATGFALLLVVSTSCEIFHGAAVQKSPIAKLKTSNSCPVDIRATFRKYLAGEASQAEVKTSFDCIHHDLVDFKNHTRSGSSHQDQYSLDEVSAFFAKYFEGVQEFSPANLKAYLKFKNFLLGGGEKQISKLELTAIQNLLVEASPVIAEMSQYISVYKMQAQLDLTNPKDSEKMSNAIANVHQLSLIIKKYLPGNKGSVFQFTDLDSLDFFDSGSSQSLSQSEAVQIIMGLKSVVLAPPALGVSGEEFKNFMTQLDLIVETGLRIKYIQDLKEDRDLLFVQNLELLRDSCTKLFQNGFSYQPKGVIPSAEFVKLLRTLDSYKMIPFGMKESSLESFLPTLTNRILASKMSTKATKLSNSDLKPDNLTVAVDAVNIWIGIQKSFLSALGDRDQIQAKDLIEQISQSAQSETDSKLFMALGQLKELLSEGVLLRWRDVERLNFAPRDTNDSFTRYDILFLSTSFSIIRPIMRAYLTDASRRQNVSAMTEPELNELYTSIRQLGKDLKFIDTRNSLAPARAFLEANIFTSVSNGNTFVEFHEAIEWFYQVWSAGKLGYRIYQEVPENCKTEQLDVFDRKKLNHECYTNYFKDHVVDFYSYLPKVEAYLKKMTEQEREIATSASLTPPLTDPWLDFDTALENAFRSTGYSTDDFDSTDTEAMSLIISYAESIFINHSRNYSDELDTKDIWATFPIMKGFIERASNGAASQEFIQKGAYSYLIYFGEMPKVDNPFGLAKFGVWTLIHYFYKEKAHVPDIVKMISSFALASKALKIKNAETYYTQNSANLKQNIIERNAKTMSDLRKIFFCSDEIAGEFSSTLGASTDTLFTLLPPTDASNFHKRVEKIIKANPKLDLECLSFE